MSVFEQGLPAGFFTRWSAVAAGLGIAGVVTIGFTIFAKVEYYTSEPKIAPACYGRTQVAGKQTIPPRGANDGNGPSVDKRQASFNIDQTTLGLRVCTPQSCPERCVERVSLGDVLVYLLAPATHLKLVSSFW